MTADTFAVQGVRGTGAAKDACFSFWAQAQGCVKTKLLLIYYIVGKSGTRLRDEDCLEEVVSANDHDNLLFFTTHGHVYALNAYDIPQASRTASGTAITQVNKAKSPVIALFIYLVHSYTWSGICLAGTSNRKAECCGSNAARLSIRR